MGRVKFYWGPSERKKIRLMFDNIPDDGCILVFNAVHATWRARVAEDYGGLFTVHACDKERALKTEKVRDLYITWRECRT